MSRLGADSRVKPRRRRGKGACSQNLLDQFDQLAKETRIPKSRLFDEAIEDLLKKYAAKDL